MRLPFVMHHLRHQLKLGLKIAACACLVIGVSAAPAAPTPAPSYQEVYELLRANLPGVDDAAMQRAAVDGLLSRFAGRASLSGTNTVAQAGELKASLRTRVIDDRFAYLHPSAVGPISTGELEKVLGDLARTNSLQGGVLDLRFSKGDNYAAASGAASLWVVGTKPLLDWGDGVKHALGVNPAGRIPWVVLVNGETSGAAEALAAALRQTDSALLAGARTAGQAAVAKEFPLQNGQRLLIATMPVKTGDGKVIPSTGLVPDIEVKVDLELERAFVDEAANRPAPSKGVASVPSDAVHRASGVTGAANGTNRPPRRRLNEAELVRMQKEGRQRSDLDLSTGSGDGAAGDGSAGPQDPALARALDLLKGLAVVRQSRGG